LGGICFGAGARRAAAAARCPDGRDVDHRLRRDDRGGRDHQHAASVLRTICRVFGAGGIGLCAISAAAIVGAHPVIAVDINQQKLDFARRFGATHVVNAQEVDPAKDPQVTDGGVGLRDRCRGLPQTQEQILRAVRPGFSGRNKGGTALLIGITPPNAKAILDTGLFVGSRSFARHKRRRLPA